MVILSASGRQCVDSIRILAEIMFTRKDKRLSSVRKRLMSQLGKRKTIKAQSTQDEQGIDTATGTTRIMSSEEGMADIIRTTLPTTTSKRWLTEVSDSLLYSSVPPIKKIIIVDHGSDNYSHTSWVIP